MTIFNQYSATVRGNTKCQQAYSVLHADDHEIFRIGIRTVLERIPRFSRIDEDVQNGDRAMILISRYRPDIAILDIDMPNSNGIEVARHIMLAQLPTKVILLSNAITPYAFEEALSLNVMGFLNKSSSLAELEPCLIDVTVGTPYISSDCVNHTNQFSATISTAGKVLQETLSKSEIKVLKLIAIGKSTPEIANELCKSTRTIDSHRYNMNQKLGLSGKYGLLSYAFQNKGVILGLPTS